MCCWLIRRLQLCSPSPVSGSGNTFDGRFFVRRILSFVPTLKRRHLTIPLPKLNYLPDRVIYRDSRLKLEVTFDPILLPVGFQPEWNRWKHLTTAKVGLQAKFVKTGKYVRRGTEWKLATWETGLSTTKGLTPAASPPPPEVVKKLTSSAAML